MTILGMVGDHPGDGGLPSMAVVTDLFEVSLYAEFQDCSTLSSGRFWTVGDHGSFHLVLIL